MQFSLEKYWWTGEVHLALMSRNWLSLASRNGQAANFRITVDGGAAWTSSDSVVAGNADYGGFAMSLSGDDAAGVPARLSRASSIDFFAEGRTLGTYQVDGAAEAMEALEACVHVMRTSDHGDPFARRRR